VQCLHLESDGTLWIGTFNGLNRLKDGRFRCHHEKKQGLQNDIICDIETMAGIFLAQFPWCIMRVNQAGTQSLRGWPDQAIALPDVWIK